MEFDITHLDKKLLIQTLYANSAPLRLGQAEYDQRKKWGENVCGLTDDECETFLYEFNHFDSGGLRILDYYNGKPMKLVFYKTIYGRVLVDSGSYDVRNGKYRFFEAMLNIFSLDEIHITKKGYKQFVMTDLPEHLIRPKEHEAIFKSLIKNTKQKESKFGKYWVIDETQASYIPSFMQSLL